METFGFRLDCKTVCIFAYSSTREQSNERSGTKLKTESETCEARALHARKPLTPRFTDFFTDFEKKPTVLQSRVRCPRSFISFYYRDATFSTLISFYCRDATFSTLTSFYCRDATFSTLISFYGS